jgi:hypothetical protein
MDKYRYHIYPDRVYVISLDESDYGTAKIEITGADIIRLLNLESYYELEEKSPETIARTFSNIVS